MSEETSKDLFLWVFQSDKNRLISKWDEKNNKHFDFWHLKLEYLIACPTPWRTGLPPSVSTGMLREFLQWSYSPHCKGIGEISSREFWSVVRAPWGYTLYLAHTACSLNFRCLLSEVRMWVLRPRDPGPFVRKMDRRQRTTRSLHGNSHFSNC